MVERAASMAAQAMEGEVIAGDPEIRWNSAAFDSRRVTGREIFFALPGAQVDGHDYVLEAVRRGAAAVVVHRDVGGIETAGTAAWIRVEDTFEALHNLTRAVRAEVPEKLVGLTGSAGKTTTKELLAAMLRAEFGREAVEKSQGNFNNTYGFPLALLAIEDGCRWMVAEMGMSTPGELGQVSRLGRPDVALFINVRPVHLENFGTLSAIGDAKAELLEGLVPGGLIVANGDDPQVVRIVERHLRERDPTARVVRFGVSSAQVDVRATTPCALREDEVGCRFRLTVDEAQGESVQIKLPVHGLYNAENCLAAAACAHALGVPLETICAAVQSFAPPSGRGEIYALRDRITLIDDSYNSNPDAAIAALESARGIPGERYVAVLGDMLELGPEAPSFHRQVGARAAELGFEPLIGVGELAREILAGSGERGIYAAHFMDAVQAAAGVPSVLRPGDVLLVKGSRGIGLEKVVETLQKTHATRRGEG